MNKLMLALTIFALSVATPATADDCDTTDATAAAGDFYVHFDADQGGLWLYQESNGQDGLQRAPEDTGSCGHADTVIF